MILFGGIYVIFGIFVWVIDLVWSSFVEDSWLFVVISEGMPLTPPQIAYKTTIISHSEKSWIFSDHNKQPTLLSKRGSHQITNPTKNPKENGNIPQQDHSLLSLTQDQILHLKEHTKKNTLQTGVDGSLRAENMTCAWSIEINNQYPTQGGTISQGSGPQNSTWAERAGLVFLLWNFDYIFTQQDIKRAKIEIHINNM